MRIRYREKSRRKNRKRERNEKTRETKTKSIVRETNGTIEEEGTEI